MSRLEDKATAMTLSTNIANFLRLVPRASIIMLALAAPVLAVPMMRADNGSIIEAPALHKSGAGFVLLVSLRRD